MSLQIRKLTGPVQIRVDAIRPNPAEGDDFDRTTPTSATPTNDANTRGVFCCELGRDPVDADFTVPNDAEEGTIAQFTITLRFYNNRNVSIDNDQTLQVTQEDVVNRRVYFTIDPGTELTGTCFYMHALIENSEERAENVSFSHSSYHETIKQVHVYAEKDIRFVYWSDSYNILDNDRPENPTDSAGIADKRYVHIKTVGMYSETVRLRISCGDQDLAIINVPLHRNHCAVPIIMNDIIARYCSENSLSGDSAQNITIDLTATVSYTDTEDQENNLECRANLTLTGNHTGISDTVPANGAIFGMVNDDNTFADTPIGYRDFTIGFMCHIEGIGELSDNQSNYGNTRAGTPRRYTVYPFHVYEIMLSDLVRCGLVTLEEASYLTTNNHDMVNLLPREHLQNTFNKMTASLSGTKTLISLFRDAENNDYAKSSAIRNVLAQVQHKPTSFGDQRVICRDAWQLASTANIPEHRYGPNHATPPGRYDHAMECPFGDFFMNYQNATFRVYAARSPENRNISVYEANNDGRPESPNRILRDGIAFHNGGSRYSIGCLTFNTRWGANDGHNVTFHNTVFPGGNNLRHLNFVCIDERNAVSHANNDHQTSTHNQQPYNSDFYRYYDQVQAGEYQ
jgi:hypothetical protein